MGRLAILGTPLTKFLLASCGHCVELWDELTPAQQVQAQEYATARGWMTSSDHISNKGLTVMEELVMVAQLSKQRDRHEG